MFNLFLSDSIVIPTFPLLIIMAFLGGIIVLAEALNRNFFSDVELTRKVVHIGAGNVIALAWWFNIPKWIGISAAIVAAMIALLSYFVPILPSINSVGRKSLGTFFYAVSMGVLIACFFPKEPQYATIGILIMAWGDGLAALIGQKFGRHRYQIFGNTKSWEGSLTMATVSYLIGVVVLLIVVGNVWQVWLVSLLVAIAAASLEAISQLGIDNLTVPIASGGLSYFLMEALASFSI